MVWNSWELVEAERPVKGLLQFHTVEMRNGLAWSWKQIQELSPDTKGTSDQLDIWWDVREERPLRNEGFLGFWMRPPGE